MCFNGYPEPPRDEDQWVDSEGDLPFLPDANEWVEPDPGDDPLYDPLKIERPDDEDS